MLAIGLVDAIYGLVIALIAALPATGALYFGLKSSRRVDEMAPKVTAIDNAVNNRPASGATLRETAEATGEAVEVLKDQEAARVVERDEGRNPPPST